MLINQDEIAHAVQRLGVDDLAIAVPFWGNGAAKSIGLSERRNLEKVRVVCNLESGACNPYEIERLRDSGVNVRTNKRLHAKVFLGKRAAIVGSSNVSANGMAIAHGDSPGMLELNVLLRDATLVDHARQWFESLWNDKNTVRLSQVLLDESKFRWENRPAYPKVAFRKRGLLNLARQAPTLFRNVYIAPFRELLSKDDQKLVQAVKAVASDQFEAGALSGLEGFSGWVDVFPNGCYLITVNGTDMNNIHLSSTMKVHDPALTSPQAPHLQFAIPSRIRIQGREAPLQITKEDRAIICGFVSKHRSKLGHLIPIAELI